MKVITKDVRAFVLDEYFKFHESPLYGYGDVFVERCDYYGAPRDCIHIPAIAEHETLLCKYYRSAEMHNCLGWGGAGENRWSFDSFDAMIDTATDVLVNQYGNQFIIDPRLMETVFCGPQDECIGWGQRIIYFINKLDDYSESIGVIRLSSLREG